MKCLKLIYLMLQEWFSNPIAVTVIDPVLFKVVREDNRICTKRPPAHHPNKKVSRKVIKKDTKKTLLKG